MSLLQLRNCNFGLNRTNLTGSNGVGYTLYNSDGSVNSIRTTTGVYQLVPDSGIYSAYISFPDDFHGQILWDTGTLLASKSYATEDYNVEANNPKIDDIYTTTENVWQATAGRWKINSISNEMVFYKEDNVTEILRFKLFDEAGQPTTDAVFERLRV
jgi:hypothetical protein